MSEEVQTKVEEVKEKVGFFKKTWKTIVTGVVCAVAGVGVTIGADAAKVQETLTKAQVRQVAIQAATYSAEQVLDKVMTIATSEKKAEAIKEAITATQAAIPQMIEAATAVKEAAKDAVSTVKETKAEATTTETKAEATATEVKTEAKTEAKAETAVVAAKKPAAPAAKTPVKK